jgi:hypothetical protein
MKRVDELIQDVKDRGSIPVDDERITNDLIVKILNQVLDEYIFPTFLKISEEFAVVKKSYNMQDVDGTTMYPSQIVPLPPRAYGQILRELKYFDGSDNLYNLPYISLQDEDRFLKGISYGAIPIGWYFLNDAVKLIGPNINVLNQGYLVMHYVLEPNVLVNKTTEFAPVDDVTYSSGSLNFITNQGSTSPVTFNTAYADLNTYCAVSSTKKFDLYRKSTGAIVRPDLVLTRAQTTTTNTFTLSGATDNDRKDIEVYQEGGFPVATAFGFTNDLILVPAEQSQYSTIPYEMDNLMVQKAVGRILELIGDTEGLQINDTRVKDLYLQVTSALGNRSRGESKRVVNRRSVLKDLKRRFRRNW